ncbi:MAG: phosphopantetheine-binding protein [Paenibacillus sp.]|uniref:phosphopantetheine-binding protein n=1 Tax=unclassified Paenibacillus TaxID=185978 RepID=UPI0003E297AC|nr:phosphopantetheine-binding protein [Paenibacillus sp. FSL R5-192]ETT32729.1 phosphopantetheine-binding protein [Paenibacillus sp. FSL R5-192]
MSHYETVCRLVKEELEDRIEENYVFSGKENLVSDLQLDSIMILQLIIKIEDEFQITIEDDELTPQLFENVEVLTAFVDTKTA